MLDPYEARQEELKIRDGPLQAHRLGRDAGEARVFPDGFSSSREGWSAWTWCLHVLFLIQSCQGLCFTLPTAGEVMQREWRC